MTTAAPTPDPNAAADPDPSDPDPSGAVTWVPAGPPALGIEVGADADVTGGWLVRAFRARHGLDGPTGILQGGLASAVPLVAARLGDTFGAPLTRVESRLHAPTPLGRELQLALRPGSGGVAHHEVELRDGDQVLVTGEVELAGHEPAPQVADLAELAHVPLPPQRPVDDYPDCWVCGASATHPHAQRCTVGRHGEAVVIPWLAETELTTDPERLTVDPLVVSGVLDCPGVWAATPALAADGWAGCLLAGYQLRMFGDPIALEPSRLVARVDAIDGRKVRVRSALLDEEGVVQAVASALHIAVRELPSLA